MAAYALRTMERIDRPSAGEVLFGMRLATPFRPAEGYYADFESRRS